MHIGGVILKIDDRRSMTGYFIFLSCDDVALSSKKQHMVSRSSTEVDYRSLANVTAKLFGSNRYLKSEKYPIPTTVNLA